MIFTIVAPPGPQGPWFEQTWIHIISESFHVKYEFFWLCGSWEDFYMTPPHFCDYLSFEEDLVLYLYNFEFPLP
jgi:hypothetical protein